MLEDISDCSLHSSDSWK